MWVLFHKSCLDGTGSAAAIVKKYPEAKLFPVNHSYKKQDIEEILNCQDEVIYVLDFSLRREDFELLLERKNQIIHIDHHVTSQEDIEYLKKYSNYQSIFDTKHSGAYLTWKYIFHNVPDLILRIEDRDIWKKEYQDTDVICYYLFSKVLDDPYELLNFLSHPIEEIYEKGLILSEYMQFSINQTLEKVEPIWISIGSFFKKKKIPALNSVFYLSELGNELAKKYDGIACIFYISNQEVKLSFRSVEGTFMYAKDAAQYFGGGGHLHAAGAKIPLKKFWKIIKT